MNNMVHFEQVDKIYGTEENKIFALKNINLSLAKGEFVVILGPSGAGKSTLLNLIGGMDKVSNGEIYIDDQAITTYNDSQLSDYRGSQIGFIFQFYNLIPTLTVWENVALVNELKNDILDSKEILKKVGLQDHMNKFPSQLSGGEQQRVSIARAVCKKPALLLCDEPTGALDIETGITILSLLKDVCRTYGCTTIIVTHNAEIAQVADKVIYVKNGGIDHIVENEHPKAVEEVKW